MLGILGGMGTFAGLHFVHNFLREWQRIYHPSKDWEYPHFILDNNCKLPSRVRHILYGEESPLKGMIKSIKHLENSGAELIILPCNTAHFFIKDIRKETKVELVDMIDLLYKYLKENDIKNIFVLASEGVIIGNVYGNRDPEIIVEYEKDMSKQRMIIEDVKKNIQNQITVDNLKQILSKDKVNILGCTEFSLLYSENMYQFNEYQILDTERIAINYLVKKLKDST